MILGMVLLDTMNIDPSAERGTGRENMVAEELLEQVIGVFSRGGGRYFGVADTVPCRDRKYKFFQNSKCDREFWDDMLIRDCLRIDYKSFKARGEV